MFGLELCTSPSEVTWPRVAVPLLTLWAQMTATDLYLQVQ